MVLLSGTPNYRTHTERHQALHTHSCGPPPALPVPQPRQVRPCNLSNWAPSPRGPACSRGHLTHRRTCQDQERPQLLLEAGQQQAAQSTALGHGVCASRPGSGLLRELHVPPCCRGADAGAERRHTGLEDSSPRPRPPPLRPPSAGRVSATLDAPLAPVTPRRARLQRPASALKQEQKSLQKC